jgi:DNA-binding SARP family transcriptional activator
MTEHLAIRTLGGLAIQLDGHPLAFETQKEAALLVYLACTGRTHPREVLAEMLWEGRTQSQSLANLRHVLAELRRCIQPYVIITRDTVAMNPASDWWLDTTAFETCLDSDGGGQLDQLEEAVDLYRGDFLAGVYVDSRAFDDWALLERERLRFYVMETLDRLVHHHTTRSNYRSGIARAIQQLQIDPLREETHRHLMRLLALSGQRAKALEQYETCARVTTARHWVCLRRWTRWRMEIGISM